VLSTVASGYYLALGIAVLLGAFAAPLPLTVALAAAGALARQGRLDLGLLFIACTLAATAGDCLGYAVGRLGGRRLRLPAWATAWAGRMHRTVQGRAWVYPRMGTLVFLTRWALTAPAPLVNVLAGARRYPWHSFLLFDLLGEMLWCATALAPGFLLGKSGGISLPLSMGAGLVLSLCCMLLSRHHRLLPRSDAGDRPKAA